MVNSLRTIFRNKKLTKETAKQKFEEWYEKVAACTLREIKSVRDTIKSSFFMYRLATCFWVRDLHSPTGFVGCAVTVLTPIPRTPATAKSPTLILESKHWANGVTCRLQTNSLTGLA
ncbi:MAG: transposase [Prevotella sp.]|nr:transposase [Prevotella sp.]